MGNQSRTNRQITVEWGALTPTVEGVGFRSKRGQTGRSPSQPDAHATLCMILRETGATGFLSPQARRFG